MGLNSRQSTRQHSSKRNPVFPTQTAFLFKVCKKLKPFSPNLNITLKSTVLDCWGILSSCWYWGQLGFLYAARMWSMTTGLVGKLARNQVTQVLPIHLGLWIIPSRSLLLLSSPSWKQEEAPKCGLLLGNTRRQNLSVICLFHLHSPISVWWSFPEVTWWVM